MTVHTTAFVWVARLQLPDMYCSSPNLLTCPCSPVILCFVFSTTTTLAQGVNLPAHLVVIKSTQYYTRGRGYIEYTPSTMLQMVGRAGRPQFGES